LLFVINLTEDVRTVVPPLQLHGYADRESGVIGRGLKSISPATRYKNFLGGRYFVLGVQLPKCPREIQPWR